MSKRTLKKYLGELDRSALAEQILDLYERIPQVKTYYDFVFNPREDRLLKEACEKIQKEYAPRGRRRPKARRSVAQRYIRHFRTLGVESHILAELMLFNIETAIAFERRSRCTDPFYRSLLNSYRELGAHVTHSGIYPAFRDRILGIADNVDKASWPNSGGFEDLAGQLEPQNL